MASVVHFTIPKEGSTIEENDDAVASSCPGDDQVTRIAIADGATESFRSGKWAQRLVDAYIDETPERLTAEWVHRVSLNFQQTVNYAELPWYLIEKAVSGSFAAFLGLRMDPERREWHLEAVGDCCLALAYHDSADTVENTRITRAPIYPKAMRTIESFGVRPSLISSNFDSHLSTPARITQKVGRGKKITFLLMTDALAAWFVSSQQIRKASDLASLSSQDEFETLVHDARQNGSLQNDDTTLARLTLRFN